MHMQFNKRIKSIFHKFQNKKCSNHYETIKNKIHKHDIKTVTMGFPDLYGRFVGKKFNSEYFLNVFKLLIFRKFSNQDQQLVITY